MGAAGAISESVPVAWSLRSEELQVAGWDISRSEVSKIEMRIREVKDWQMMILVRVLDAPHEAFYPKLDLKKPMRETLEEVMQWKFKLRDSTA